MNEYLEYPEVLSNNKSLEHRSKEQLDEMCRSINEITKKYDFVILNSDGLPIKT